MSRGLGNYPPLELPQRGRIIRQNRRQQKEAIVSNLCPIVRHLRQANRFGFVGEASRNIRFFRLGVAQQLSQFCHAASNSFAQKSTCQKLGVGGSGGNRMARFSVQTFYGTPRVSISPGFTGAFCTSKLAKFVRRSFTSAALLARTVNKAAKSCTNYALLVEPAARNLLSKADLSQTSRGRLFAGHRIGTRDHHEMAGGRIEKH